jgi:hypothetical protein
LWTRAHFGYQEPVDMPFAHVKSPGQAGDAVAVDDAIGDEKHRSGDEVGAHVPLR